jgi:hypothetical protein
MKMTKTKQNEAAPVTQQVETGNESKPTTYVVVREGLRVSDHDYCSPDDENALLEKAFWTNIAQKHSHGEPVEIVPYDSKRHRVW